MIKISCSPIIQVTNVDKSARKLDISFKLKSPDGRIANFQGRKTEGSFLGHEAQHFGDYEICFNNRFDSLILSAHFEWHSWI